MVPCGSSESVNVMLLPLGRTRNLITNGSEIRTETIDELGSELVLGEANIVVVKLSDPSFENGRICIDCVSRRME